MSGPTCSTCQMGSSVWPSTRRWSSSLFGSCSCLAYTQITTLASLGSIFQLGNLAQVIFKTSVSQSSAHKGWRNLSNKETRSTRVCRTWKFSSTIRWIDNYSLSRQMGSALSSWAATQIKWCKWRRRRRVPLGDCFSSRLEKQIMAPLTLSRIAMSLSHQY